jgi:hypothetical protein
VHQHLGISRISHVFATPQRTSSIDACMRMLSVYACAGIPKGQYKGYTCPQCTRAKVSAQHSRQKEKKKKSGTEKVSTNVTNNQTQPTIDGPGSTATKIPILDAKVRTITYTFLSNDMMVRCLFSRKKKRRLLFRFSASILTTDINIFICCVSSSVLD